MTALELADTIEAALRDLAPINPGGYPARALIVTVSPGVVGNRRASGRATNRAHTITVMCIGQTADEATWLAHHVTDRLDGGRIGSPHGTITDASYDGDPIPETPTAPASWSKTLHFSWTVKRGT